MTEQEQMNDLIEKVHQWGVDRKIIGNGKLETQWLKLLSEFGEMCDTLAKGGDPIDDIGDQLVVLIMMAGIAGMLSEFVSAARELGADERATDKHSVYLICGRVRYMAGGVSEVAMKCLLEPLASIANNHSLTLHQCLEHAYSQIKDRKGYLNELGVFIKE